MKIFFSCSHRDKSDFEELISHLQLIDRGIEAFSSFSLEPGMDARSSMISLIRSCDVAVVSFSGRSDTVLFEAGIATGLGKPMIAVTRDASLVPSDLTNIPFIKLIDEPNQDAFMLHRQIREFDTGERFDETAFSSAEATLMACVQNRSLLESMSPQSFELTIEMFFAERGFEVDTQIGANSGEIDFLVRDPNENLNFLVETKKLTQHAKVSSETVERVASLTSILGATIGLVVASSGFTSSAFALAAKYGVALRTIEDLLKSKSLKDLISRD